MAAQHQESLFMEEQVIKPFQTQTPANVWDQDAAKRALDELLSLTSKY